ncbi:MAG: hypothetical protein R3F35_13215 [Myxococcota bacterium]
MSVHGEYARSLAAVRETLAECGAPWQDAFRPALEAARATPERDLSTAARSAREALDRLQEALEGPSAEGAAGRDRRGDPPIPSAPTDDESTTKAERRLRAACDHLRAHVDAILGTRPTQR